MNCAQEMILPPIARTAFKRHFRECLSITSVLKRYESTSQQVLKVETKKSHPMAVKKPLQKTPFVKNLFLGRFDRDVLTYPEVLDKERLQTLQEMVAPIEKFFSAVDSKEIDETGHIPSEIINHLKSLGLFGLQIPEEWGGLGLNATEYARLGEITALDGSIAVTLAAHQSLGLKGLLIAGSEEQKQHYLPQLATGECIAAFCLTEPASGSDVVSMKTKAVLSDDKKTWILNGSKIWISNGGIANFFTVFAKTENVDYKGERVESITAFLVEREFGGVTNGKPEDKLGVRGSNTCEVTFNNTPVPVGNILGEEGEGFKLAMDILNSGHFSVGSSCAGVLKKLIGLTTQHAINRNQFGKPLTEFELIQEKMAKITCTTYAMESMAYLTAGFLDSYENPDCSTESAIVKVFSSEGCWNAVSECLQILGGLGYMKQFPYERYLRDSRITLMFEGTNDVLRMFIAMSGIQYAANQFHADMKARSLFTLPQYVVKKTWQTKLQSVGTPKLNLGLDGYLHPSLKVPSDLLEYCVLRLQYGVEIALSRYLKEVGEKQMVLRRLADAAIDIYAMTAVLGRASRSYCIGLQNAEDEIVMAIAFCHDAYRRVKRNILEIEHPLTTNDELYKNVAQYVFQRHGYFPQHPLATNDSISH